MMPENQSLVIEPGGVVRYGDTLDLKEVYVESGSITEGTDHVKDRQLMFQQGVVVAVISRDKAQDRLEIDIIPRGFAKELEAHILTSIKEDLAKGMNLQDLEGDKLYSKDKISKEVSRMFIKYVGKNPVVIPVIISN